MPTVLERATVTITPPVQRMLTSATRWWPGLSVRELMLRLMAEGAASMREKELEAAYADAYADWAASEDADLWDAASGDGIGESE